MIRRVEPNDIFPVITLAFDTLPERYNPSIFNQFYESCPEGFLVALQNKTIIGFLIGIKTTPNIARILMIAVEDSFRKKGIGSALLTQFIKEMKNQQITKVELEVRTSNKNALRFYKKRGFLLQATLQKFYQNGENAYSMGKEL
ncbi:MAG TPA: ribosomal protein S18-alanine N-acetyltransferase [Thermoplasmata archaeon]|jgi:[ribosomal protein S18]-alanine N-acetyltransferase|nr:ribosomal protein S18-alanine N-acetyltransferase [Thermoplasmata archaeon]